MFSPIVTKKELTEQNHQSTPLWREDVHRGTAQCMRLQRPVHTQRILQRDRAPQVYAHTSPWSHSTAAPSDSAEHKEGKQTANNT